MHAYVYYVIIYCLMFYLACNKLWWSKLQDLILIAADAYNFDIKLPVLYYN